ncbi:hypothetical protein QTN25_003230 [Entamoeba marina]
MNSSKKRAIRRLTNKDVRMLEDPTQFPNLCAMVEYELSTTKQTTQLDLSFDLIFSRCLESIVIPNNIKLLAIVMNQNNAYYQKSTSVYYKFYQKMVAAREALSKQLHKLTFETETDFNWFHAFIELLKSLNWSFKFETSKLSAYYLVFPSYIELFKNLPYTHFLDIRKHLLTNKNTEIAPFEYLAICTYMLNIPDSTVEDSFYYLYLPLIKHVDLSNQPFTPLCRIFECLPAEKHDEIIQQLLNYDVFTQHELMLFEQCANSYKNNYLLQLVNKVKIFLSRHDDNEQLNQQIIPDVFKQLKCSLIQSNIFYQSQKEQFQNNIKNSLSHLQQSNSDVMSHIILIHDIMKKVNWSFDIRDQLLIEALPDFVQQLLSQHIEMNQITQTFIETSLQEQPFRSYPALSLILSITPKYDLSKLIPHVETNQFLTFLHMLPSVLKNSFSHFCKKIPPMFEHYKLLLCCSSENDAAIKILQILPTLEQKQFTTLLHYCVHQSKDLDKSDYPLYQFLLNNVVDIPLATRQMTQILFFLISLTQQSENLFDLFIQTNPIKSEIISGRLNQITGDVITREFYYPKHFPLIFFDSNTNTCVYETPSIGLTIPDNIFDYLLNNIENTDVLPTLLMLPPCSKHVQVVNQYLSNSNYSLFTPDNKGLYYLFVALSMEYDLCGKLPAVSSPELMVILYSHFELINENGSLLRTTPCGVPLPSLDINRPQLINIHGFNENTQNGIVNGLIYPQKMLTTSMEYIREDIDDQRVIKEIENGNIEFAKAVTVQYRYWYPWLTNYFNQLVEKKIIKPTHSNFFYALFNNMGKEELLKYPILYCSQLLLFSWILLEPNRGSVSFSNIQLFKTLSVIGAGKLLQQFFQEHLKEIVCFFYNFHSDFIRDEKQREELMDALNICPLTKLIPYLCDIIHVTSSSLNNLSVSMEMSTFQSFLKSLKKESSSLHLNPKQIQEICGHEVDVTVQDDAFLFLNDVLDKSTQPGHKNFFTVQTIMTLTCTSCKSKREKVDVLYNLSVGLDSDLSESVLALEKEETEILECEKCCKMQQHQIKRQVCGSSSLLISINRISNTLDKLDSKIKIPTIIHSYHLTGAVLHRGTYMGGHYTTVAKVSIGNKGKWYWFDDATVSVISEQKVIELCQGGESYEWNAVILMYETQPKHFPMKKRVESMDQLISKYVIYSTDFKKVIKYVMEHFNEVSVGEQRKFLEKFIDVIMKSPLKNTFWNQWIKYETVTQELLNHETRTMELTDGYIRMKINSERLFQLLNSNINKSNYTKNFINYITNVLSQNLVVMDMCLFTKADIIFEFILSSVISFEIDHVISFYLEKIPLLKTNVDSSPFFNVILDMLFLCNSTSFASSIIELIRPSSFFTNTFVDYKKVFIRYQYVLERYYSNALDEIKLDYFTKLLNFLSQSPSTSAFVLEVLNVIGKIPTSLNFYKSCYSKYQHLQKNKLSADQIDAFTIFFTSQKSFHEL